MADIFDNPEQLTALEQNNNSIIVGGELYTATDGVVEPIIVTAEVEQSGTPLDGPEWQNQNTDVSPTYLQQTILPNPLLDYTTVTYNLSLHVLPVTVYNQLMANPDARYSPQNVIVASAGRYQSERNASFKEDFYFEDFKMTTHINTTIRNRSSNLIECSFTLIEPLGFTFINRLIEANRSINGSNYLKQPYLLEIDFLVGSDDGNTVAAPLVDEQGRRQTKWIPIMLTGIKTRVTNKGTEYQIEAVPYNHHAMSTLLIATPANFKIKAASVKDALGTGGASTQFVSAFTQARETESEIARLTAVANNTNANRSAREFAVSELARLNTNSASKSGVIYENAGLTDLINAWQEDLVQGGVIKARNTYIIDIDASIGEALMYDNKATTQSAADIDNTQTAQKAAAGFNASALSWVGGVMNIPRGTKIDQFIEFAIRNSSYIKDQIEDPQAGADQTKLVLKDPSKPLRWFRIIPSIQISRYDDSTNSYTYTITYKVRPWTMQVKHPLVTNGRVPGWVKEYNYIFTGKNTDVLDCQIDFDLLYYTQMISMRDQRALQTPTLDSTRNAGLKGSAQDRLNTQETGAVVPCTDPVMPVPLGYVSDTTNLQTLNTKDSVKQATATDVQNSLQLTAKGDMINVKLKILGDPQLIKQDDIFYGQGLATGQGLSQRTPNGSVFTDDGELYVLLKFLSPTDYNDELGLAVPSNYDYSVFSGTYKIITVESQFYKGKFEQTLDLARVPVSASCQAYGVASNGAYVSALLGQLPTTTTSTRFAGPAILVNNLASGGGLSLSGFAKELENLALGKIQTEISKAVSGVVDGLVTSLSDTLSGWTQNPTLGPAPSFIWTDVDGNPVLTGTGDFIYTTAGTDFLNSSDLVSGYSPDINLSSSFVYDDLSTSVIPDVPSLPDGFIEI